MLLLLLLSVLGTGPRCSALATSFARLKCRAGVCAAAVRLTGPGQAAAAAGTPPVRTQRGLRGGGRRMVACRTPRRDCDAFGMHPSKPAPHQEGGAVPITLCCRRDLEPYTSPPPLSLLSRMGLRVMPSAKQLEEAGKCRTCTATLGRGSVARRCAPPAYMATCILRFAHNTTRERVPSFERHPHCCCCRAAGPGDSREAGRRVSGGGLLPGAAQPAQASGVLGG